VDQHDSFRCKTTFFVVQKDSIPLAENDTVAPFLPACFFPFSHCQSRG
jgi:hypothetical protein